jgi:CPA2 family monovalent cation:H+ antiporter-2
VPHSVTLISTIAAGLGLALIMGFIAARLKLPVLVGYLVAGIIIGPATPGFVADVELSSQLAEIGEITVATVLGMAVSAAWGWSLAAGIVFGLALSVASTVVLLKALESRGVLDSVNGRIAIGWLLVEDLVMVLVLVLLPAMALWLGGTENAAAEPPGNRSLSITLALTIGQVSVFVALMLVVGRRLFPWLLWQIARTGSRELFTLCIVAAAVGIAYGSAALFGVSFALGAFFAGMVMRESPLSYRAAEESLPLRDAFSVLFFVSVGMLFEPEVLIREPLHVLIVLAIIIFGKSLAAFVIVLLFRYPLNTAFTVSASLAQIGEFSFILANFGVSLGILPAEGQSLILAGAIISIAVNPLLFKAIEPAQAWIRSRSKLAQALERPDDPLAALPMTTDLKRLTGHVVVVGYGRVGRRIGEALTAHGISIVVAEENREIVERLRSSGIAAVSGDASDSAVLLQAHVHRASILVIATPDTLNVRKMIEIARTVNPRIETVVRTHSEEEAVLLEKEQAGKVFLGEHELATGMIQHVLERYTVKTEHNKPLPER